MANGYDGEIKLSVTLSADDVKRSAQDLSNNIKRIFESTKGQNLDSSMKSLQTQMSKAVTKAQELQSAMERLENTEVPTEEYKEIEAQINKARDALVKLLDKQEKFIETGGDMKSKAYQGMQYDVEQLRMTIEYAEGDLQDLIDTGKAFKLGAGTSEYENLKNQLGEVNNRMRTLTTSAEKYSQKANKASTDTKKLGSEMSKTSNKTGGFASGLGKAIGKFAMFAIGVRSVYAAFQKIKQAITDGLTSMAKMNGGVNSANSSISQLVSSLNYLKGALASAFLPILNVVSPILSNLIDQIANVITAIGMMIAKLTGATSFTRVVKKNTNYAASQGGSSGKSAQEKYDEKVKKAQEAYDKKVAQTEAKNAERMAKAEEKQAKAAKKLAKEQEKANGKLAAFDDLNVLGVETLEELEDVEADLLEMPEFEMPEMDLSGGGGAGDPFGLEEQALEPMENAFLDWLKDMIDAFVDGFNSAWDKLDLDARIAKLKDYFKQIKDALTDIFTDPAVISAFNSMMQAFMHMLGALAADFISIGVSIATFVVGGIAQYLTEDGTVERIKEYLIEMFSIREDIFHTIEELGNAIANIFTVLETPEALSFSENFVGIFVEAFMNVTELCSKFGRDVIDAIARPIIENQEQIKSAFQTMFGQADVVLSSIRNTLDSFGQKLNSFYDEHLGPFITSIGEGLSELFSFILGLYETYISPFMDVLVQNLADLLDNHIIPFINTVIDVLGPIIDLLKLLWEGLLVPLFEFLALRLATLWNALSVVFDFVIMGIKLILDHITLMLDALKIFLDFIVNIFTKGFSEAWDILNAKLEEWNEKLLEFFSIDYWKELGGNVIDGLSEGIENGWKTFKDNAGAIGQRVIDKFKVDTDVGSPSKKAEEVGEFIVEGLFLPFNEQSVNANVTPFANSILAILKETLTGTNVSDIGVQIIDSIVQGLTSQIPVLETFILEQFTVLAELLNEQIALLIETVGVTSQELFNVWFDEAMQLWWDEHVLTWFTAEKWQADIFEPFLALLQSQWDVFTKWWNDCLKTWWDNFKKWWNDTLKELKKLFEEFMKKYQDALDNIKEATDETFTEIQEIMIEKIGEAKTAVLEACDEMRAAILEIIGLMSSLGGFMGGGIAGITAGVAGGGNGGGFGGGPRSFMPMLDVMHFEDNLGMSAFRFPELATGAVIPPNNEFLAILGDQRTGTNIETPLATMLEAFRSVMDEYMGGSHQSATMEVDGETFARLMMPHIMDEMHRLGYNTEIIEGM